MFQIKGVEKIKTRILYLITFFRKSCRLWDSVEKYGTARQATGDNVIRRMRFACWITKATDTRSGHVILTASPVEQWLRERALLLCLYVHCLSCSCFPSVLTNHINPPPPNLKFLPKFVNRSFHFIVTPASVTALVNKSNNLDCVRSLQVPV
jgi:hypothetical protein